MRELIGKVIIELGHVFDVLSVKILENRKRIMALETRIKELDTIKDKQFEIDADGTETEKDSIL